MSSPSARLDDWLAQHPDLCRRVIVPAALKWEIRDKLDQANVNERVLFPGLDGLSRWLARYYTPACAPSRISTAGGDADHGGRRADTAPRSAQEGRSCTSVPYRDDGDRNHRTRRTRGAARRRAARPRPRSGEVLVRVDAAGVNSPDVMQRRGQYTRRHLARLTFPGWRSPARSSRVGPSVTRWRVGDRVCALVAGGGYAEYCVAPRRSVFPFREVSTLCRAAAIPETFFTVWTNLFQRGALQRRRARARFMAARAASARPPFNSRMRSGRSCSRRPGRTDKCAACRRLGAASPSTIERDDFVRGDPARDERIRRRCHPRHHRRRLLPAQHRLPRDERATGANRHARRRACRGRPHAG